MRPRRRRKSTAGGAGRRRIAAPLVALLCLCADPRRGASAADRGVSEEERERVRQWQRRMAAEDAAFGRRREGRRGRPGGPAPPPAPEPSEEGGDDQDGNPLSGLSIFSTRRPRDALEGLRSGLVNGLAGAVYGLAAFVAGPVAGFGAGGAAGGLGGLLAGTVLGALLPLAGLVSGAVQLVRGLAATPAAVRDGFWRCMVYDEEEREWRVYNLDDDVADIEAGLRAEKKKGGGAAGGAGRAGGRRVRSAEYYELLGVRTDATTSEIRSAYRRGARDVHPDKNKDDPEAEAKFRMLSAAYQTLSDPDRRRRYDSSGVGIDPEGSNGGPDGAMLDPIVFFAVLFGSDLVEPYVGDLGMATAFDSLMKLGSQAQGGEAISSLEDLRNALGWSETALRRRRREAGIAVHLRSRTEDYVDGLLAVAAFRDSCREEALAIASGGSYGASYLLAIGPSLMAEADAFLGYRSSVLGAWRGPVSGLGRAWLTARRRLAVGGALFRAARAGVAALYRSGEFTTVRDGGDGGRERRTFEPDAGRLRDNLQGAIPSVLEMAWAMNYADITVALRGACDRLFHDAAAASGGERLRRAEAVRILGGEFYLVGIDAAGGRGARPAADGDVDDIKARASAAFEESVRSGSGDRKNRDGWSHDEM